jgi:hypothetical protein
MSLGTPTATIADSASQSGIVELGDEDTVIGLTTDSAWDANKITFLVSNQRAANATEYAALTFTPLYLETGAEAALGSTTNIAASASVLVPDSWLKGWRWMKVRSGTAAAAVNQSGATTIRLSLRKVE